jgi:nucleotide-binding universal stress UspA family protein
MSLMPTPFRLQTDTLLAALDLGGGWLHVVDHAAQLARCLSARLHLVTVLEQPHWLLRKVMDSATFEANQAERHQHASRLLAEACARAGDLITTTEIRVGVPTEELMAARQGVGAQLIVCGTGARKDASHILLGGTAERILGTSPVPVYVAALRPAVVPRRVLVPTGLGPSGARAIEVAHHLAYGCGGSPQVAALHMVALPSVLSPYMGDVLKLRAELEAAANEEFSAHLATVTLPPDAPPPLRILRTNLEVVPADEIIVREARALDADLICFALGGRKLLDTLVLGRVSNKVIRALPCPLLALPDVWLNPR